MVPSGKTQMSNVMLLDVLNSGASLTRHRALSLNNELPQVVGYGGWYTADAI